MEDTHEGRSESCPAIGPGTNETVESISTNGSVPTPDERVVAGSSGIDTGEANSFGVEEALNRLQEADSVKQSLDNMEVDDEPSRA